MTPPRVAVFADGTAVALPAYLRMSTADLDRFVTRLTTEMTGLPAIVAGPNGFPNAGEDTPVTRFTMPAATPHTVTVTSVSNQADVPYATELNAILGLFRSLAEQIDAHGRAYAPARVRFAVLDGPADEPQTRSWPVGVPMPTLDLDGRRAAVVSLTDSNATAVIRLGPAGESWVARAPTGQPVRISWRYAMPDE